MLREQRAILAPLRKHFLPPRGNDLGLALERRLKRRASGALLGNWQANKTTASIV
jgi:hypothetical protein